MKIVYNPSIINNPQRIIIDMLFSNFLPGSFFSEDGLFIGLISRVSEFISSQTPWLGSVPIITEIVKCGLILSVAYAIYRLMMVFVSPVAHYLPGKINVGTGLVGEVVIGCLANKILLRQLSQYLCFALVIKLASHIGAESLESFLILVSRISLIVLSGMMAFTILDVVLETTGNKGAQFKFPVKSVVQLSKVVITLICFTIVVSLMVDKSPRYLLTSLGALSAILMLVFKDSILGLIAGIQLAANRIVSVGDRIQIGDTEGHVEDISLTIVKIRNFDNTITSLPCGELTNKAVKNWSSLHDTGRRIKRTINIDISSISFIDFNKAKEMLNTFPVSEIVSNDLLADYYFKRSNSSNSPITNIGLFRFFIESYLKSIDMIIQDDNLVVKLSQPTEMGVPIEIYCFTTKSEWIDFETIQSNMFDYLLCAIPIFGLRIFQSPSGSDIRSTAPFSQ